MALFPAAAQVVVAIDVAKLRASPAAAKLSALATQSEADKKDLDELMRRTGFDPVRQIQSLTLAFPEEARAQRRARAHPARRSSRRDPPRRLRSRQPAEDGRRFGGDAARPIHALVDEEGSRPGRLLRRRRTPSRWGAAAGRRGSPIWRKTRGPATARPPTWSWRRSWNARPVRTPSGRWRSSRGRVDDAGRAIRACRCGGGADAVSAAIDFGKGARGGDDRRSRRPPDAADARRAGHGGLARRQAQSPGADAGARPVPGRGDAPAPSTRPWRFTRRSAKPPSTICSNRLKALATVMRGSGGFRAPRRPRNSRPAANRPRGWDRAAMTSWNWR